MKNTKSRKKMLISSIAMLLVALVALGSATYAWFSVSKTVKADTIQVKAIAAAGLEISNNDGNSYSTNVSFANSYDLKPVSFSTTADTNGFYPAGNVESPGGAYNGTDYTSVAKYVTPDAVQDTTGKAQKSTGGYFATYRVYVRSAAEDGVRTGHAVSATVKASGDGKSFVRAWLKDDTTAANSKVYNDGGVDTTAIKSTAGASDTIAASNFGTANAVTATDTTDTGKVYTLVVWFEGSDADCIDAAKNQTANLTIEFTATDM